MYPSSLLGENNVDQCLLLFFSLSNLKALSRTGTNIHLLQMGKSRHKSINNMTKVIQKVNDEVCVQETLGKFCSSVIPG